MLQNIHIFTPSPFIYPTVRMDIHIHVETFLNEQADVVLKDSAMLADILDILKEKKLLAAIPKDQLGFYYQGEFVEDPYRSLAELGVKDGATVHVRWLSCCCV